MHWTHWPVSTITSPGDPAETTPTIFRATGLFLLAPFVSDARTAKPSMALLLKRG